MASSRRKRRRFAVRHSSIHGKGVFALRKIRKGERLIEYTGDRILLDVPKRRLELKVSPAELAKRKKAWRKAPVRPEDRRGYRKLFMETVTQADRGCDFDFCVPPLTARVPRPEK